MTEKEIMKLIGDCLTDKSISNYAIAKKMNKSKTTISKWLNCVTYPDLPDLLQLLEIADIEISLVKI